MAFSYSALLRPSPADPTGRRVGPNPSGRLQRYTARQCHPSRHPSMTAVTARRVGPTRWPVESARVARPLGAKVKLASNPASIYKYLVFTELERLETVVHKMEVTFQRLRVSAQTRQTIECQYSTSTTVFL